MHSGWLRRTFSAPMMVALLALLVATSGTTYAALVVTGKNVKDGTLTTRDVKNRSLLKKDFKRGQLPGRAATQIDLTVVHAIGTPSRGDAIVGPYTLRVVCQDDGSESNRYMILNVLGPLGSQAQSAGIHGLDGTGQTAISSDAVAVSPGGDGSHLATIGIDNPFPGSTSGRRYRYVGTIVLSNVGQVITVAIEMTLDASGEGTCAIHGTAVKAN